MEIELNDKSLMFLALPWDVTDFDPEINNLVQTFQTLWYLCWILKRNEIKLDNGLVAKDFQESLVKQLDRLLDHLSDILLTTKPKDVLKGTQDLEKIQNDFEEILLTLGEKEKYREHARHQKRNFFLGLFLVDRLNLEILDKSLLVRQWYPAACLHDFCYILQEIQRVTESLAGKVADSFPGMKFRMSITSRFGSEFLVEKQKRILASIARADKKTTALNEDYFSLLEKIEDRDHGIMSALFVHDLLYREQSKYSIKDLDAVTRAIAFHTNGRHRCSVKTEKDPLACMLILCDEIQEWKRPFSGNGSGYTKGIELRNIDIGFEKWKAEKIFIKAMLRRKSFRILKHKLQVGDKQFEVLINLKLNTMKDQWFFEMQIETRFPSRLDEMDLKAFKQKMTSEFNNFATSLFEKDINILRRSKKRIGEDNLNLMLSGNNKVIKGNICILGKMKDLPASTNTSVFDVLFSWVLLNYVRGKETKRQSVRLKLERGQSLEFNLPHLSDRENRHVNSRQQDKVRNLQRIDHAKKPAYGKISILASSGENKEIRFFPCKQNELQ